MGVSVGSVAEAGLAPATDFDAVLGVPARVPESAAPEVVHRPVVLRRRDGRRPALIAFGALVVAGITLGASVIVSIEVAQSPIARATHALTGDKLTAAAATSDPVATGPAFGTAAGLGTDLAVTISDPIAYSPSPKAVGAGGGVDVVSTVTVTNLASGPAVPQLDIALLGTTGTRIFDGPAGIRVGNSRVLQAGESVSYRVAFAVADVSKMAVQVSNDSGDTTSFHG